MQEFDPQILKSLYRSPSDSHKGQNGKLLLIGGSHLFHAASLWSLGIASRIVDMVFYASVPENNEIVKEAKKEFRDGIVVPRQDLENYVAESDCILIGPGMVRTEKPLRPTEDYQIQSLTGLDKIENEGIQTYYLTKYLLEKYPDKKWVIDAGALQMMDPVWLKKLPHVIVTPHQQEFTRVFGVAATPRAVEEKAMEYSAVILLKGEEDTVCSPQVCVRVTGGNAGMTKGGTGDVLAGLVAALACKNEMLLAAQAGSYFNKKAGDTLFAKVGPFFNSSDLVNEIPFVMKKILFG